MAINERKEARAASVRLQPAVPPAIFMHLDILYRGPLASCNYGCTYCPFAKRQESRAEHAQDAAALQHFADWVAGQTAHSIGVFFTPWGEALIHRRYQQAIVALSQLPHVHKVAIQTNLAPRLGWLAQGRLERIGLWATYHPSQISRAQFLRRCAEARELGVRFSVGVVGLREHLDEIAALRDALPADVYLWVNAYKREPNYYSPAELAQISAIDPLFHWNTVEHPALGQACRAGASVISVDGDGTMRRCHFIRTPIGNLYDEEWEQALQERVCTNQGCRCHIGYVHMDALKLREVYGDGLLERIPAQWPLLRP